MYSIKQHIIWTYCYSTLRMRPNFNHYIEELLVHLTIYSFKKKEFRLASSNIKTTKIRRRIKKTFLS